MKHQLGTVRIIGGKWRSRRLLVPKEGVRPSLDTVKETLFNWLAPILPGAQCLDLFAGTGSLGFEALSRGAGSVDMVEANPSTVKQLQEQAGVFGLEGANFHVYGLSLPRGLLTLPQKAYDIVFIDPPYHKDLLWPCCELLEKQNLLSPGAWIYVEMEKILSRTPPSSKWTCYREKTLGQLAYCLYRYELSE